MIRPRASDLAIVAMTACTFVPAGAEPNDPAGQEADTAAPDLSAFLIRDPAIQTELGLSPDQRRAIRTLLDEVDGPLWALRDLPPKEAGEKLRPLVVRVENGLAGLLDARQRSRLDQIAVQYRGLPALLDPDLSGKLSLRDDQRGQIQSIVRETRLTLRKLEERSRKGERRDVLEDTAGRLRTDGREKILAVLTAPQKRQWATLVGEPFDLSRANPLAVKAPELREANAWVNSEPLSLAKLRGRVVALHFWTFGCSNCIHNYPAYKAWHTAYSEKGLTILGIHTPETQAERVLDRQEGLCSLLVVWRAQLAGRRGRKVDAGENRRAARGGWVRWEVTARAGQDAWAPEDSSRRSE